MKSFFSLAFTLFAVQYFLPSSFSQPLFPLVDKGVMVKDTRLAAEVAVLTMDRKRSASEIQELVLNPALKPFYHGVASGDPLNDRVMLWTRVTPERDTMLPVRWIIARDTGLRNIVRTGTFTTTAERDYTVKLDVTGLEANTTYYYQFSALGRNSIIGRTKTLPSNVADIRQAKVAIVSCSSYPHGFFNAYGRIADRNDIDVVLHLGDYIYEYNTSETSYGGEMGRKLGRVSEPTNEILSLADYRTRYSQYRLDQDLMRLHQQHPIVHIWDDHESANDSYADGAENHTPSTEGSWALRKAISKRVVYEWMPTRENADTLIRRRFQIGNLVDIFMLDTRLEGREEQISPVGPANEKAKRDSAINNPNRQLLGKQQFDWLTNGLKSSSARWKLLGNQVMFSPMSVNGLDAFFVAKYAAILIPFTGRLTETLEDAFYGDVWSNYPAERKRLVDFISQNSIKNVVIGTGDFHTAFAFDVTLDASDSTKYNRTTGKGASAVEFMCPSITSGNFDENLYSGFRNFFYNQFRPFMPAALAFMQGVGIAESITSPMLQALEDFVEEKNRHLKFHNISKHGYTLLTFTPEGVQGDYWFMDTILTRSPKEHFGGGLFTRAGESNLQRRTSPAALATLQHSPAPGFQQSSSVSSILTPAIANPSSELTLLAAYPNPASSIVYLNYTVNSPAQVTVRLLDISGKERAVLVQGVQQYGAVTLLVDLAHLGLPSGTYRYVISTSAGSMQTRDLTLVR